MNSKNPPFKLKPGVKVDQSIPDPSQVQEGRFNREKQKHKEQPSDRVDKRESNKKKQNGSG